MTRHLVQCVAAHAKESTQGETLLHLVIQGKYLPQYWLHVEIPASAKFAELDAFLRNIWLECCGHLSQFIIAGVRYIENELDDPFFDDPEDASMDETIGTVLRPGMQFEHEYDFGSTTHLTGKVVSSRVGVLVGDHPVRLLARNNPPEIPCGVCGQPATQIDTEGAWSPDSWLCDTCASERGGEEYFLPAANSPRVGVCGYTGY